MVPEGKISVAPHIYVGLQKTAKNKVSKRYHVMYGMTYKRILALTSEAFGVSLVEAMSRSRMHEAVCARRAYIAISRYHLGSSYNTIGMLIERDHSTVLHNLRRHNDWMQVYPEYAGIYESIEKEIKFKPLLDGEEDKPVGDQV